MRICCRRQQRKLSFEQSGFTLVELLVVVVIITILVSFSLDPLTMGIKRAQETVSMESCRQLGLMEFAYSNDHGQVYPFGPAYSGGSETIANLLLNDNYASDPNVFYVGGTPGAVKPTTSASSIYDQTTKFVCYDFMVNSNINTGLTSLSADYTPLCELTGGIYSMSATARPSGIYAEIDISKAAFGSDGIAVTYKSNNAIFLKAHQTTTSNVAVSLEPIVPPSYIDRAASGYSLTRP